jgi:hypothetical protein
MNASPDIVPTASKDVAPLQGWSRMPSEVNVPVTMTASAPAQAPPGPSPDAGVDGAAAGSSPNSTDAGAIRPKINQKKP